MLDAFHNYHKAVRDLESIITLPIKNYEQKNTGRSFFIERLRYLLNLLDNPQQGFKYIHVTGTAGKGTTVNLIHKAIRANGHKVGCYFSPHTTTSIERIKVNDLYISPNDFADLMDKIKPALKMCSKSSPYGHPSYFETFLSLAFLYFKKQQCEYVVLEAGLGGRHDATNIVANPLITIITNINYDHQEVLGRSLTGIAKDKADIIKSGSIFLTTETRPALLKIFKGKCQKVGAKFYSVSGDKEKQNLALAKKTAEILRFDPKKTETGFRRAKLPCRFETIQKKPVVILDGSHNPAKMTMVASHLTCLNYDKLIVILGMAKNKDHFKTLAQIAPLADCLILTKSENPYREAISPVKLKTVVRQLKIKKKQIIKMFIRPKEALKFGQKIQNINDCLLITGSFFLTGELRVNWITEVDILINRRSYKI